MLKLPRKFLTLIVSNNGSTLKGSLNVIQTGTIRKLGYGLLFAFHSNYGRIFNRLRYSASKNSVTLKTGLGNCSRSLNMARFDRPYTTFYWSANLLPFLSYLTLSDIMTLKSGFEVTQCYSNRYHSKVWVRFPIRLT